MATKNTTKDKERKFLIECIELYRNLPALWQVKNKFYHDRNKKNMAYDILLSKYREMFPQATKDDVKKKFNSLRTNYRKELKKYVNSMKSGGSTDSIYVPTLWYYGEMSFLYDEELPLESVSSMDTDKNTSDCDDDNEERGHVDNLLRPCADLGMQDDSLIEWKYDVEKQETHTTVYRNQDSTRKTPSRIISNHAPKRFKKNEKQSYESLSEINDEYYHWAMSCAADLRKMDRTQQLYAKKAIAEIIMEGQLGLLHRHSVKVNENTQFNYSVQFGHPSPSPKYSNPTPSPPNTDTIV